MPASDPIRFILVGTSHAGNVGAAARAMKVMGFSDLVLVAPRLADLHASDEAVARASGATDVLARARVVRSLVDALDDITFVCATAMTPRDFGPPTHAPRDLFASLAPTAHRVGLVFGSERVGLANADVYTCHACLSIATAPAYGSLNLAQAVQLIAYEWRQALGGFDAMPRNALPPAADAVAVHGLLAHWRGTLAELGFLDPAVPRKLMARLHRLANRAAPTNDEVQILRGIAAAIDKQCRMRASELGRSDAAAAPSADPADPAAPAAPAAPADRADLGGPP